MHNKVHMNFSDLFKGSKGNRNKTLHEVESNGGTRDNNNTGSREYLHGKYTNLMCLLE